MVKTLWKTFDSSLEVKHIPIIWLSHATPRYLPKIKAYIHTKMCIFDLSGVSKMEMSINRWGINKLWFIHAVKCYLAIKSKALLLHNTTLVNLKIIKETYCVIQFKWNSMKCKLIYSDRKPISGCLCMVRT